MAKSCACALRCITGSDRPVCAYMLTLLNPPQMRTIAHISDLHFGSHDTAIARCLLESIGDAKPDLVVLSGDLTQRARHSEFVQARHFVEQIEQPVLIVPGNHDIPLYNLLHRFLSPLEKFRHHMAPTALTNDWYCDEELAVLGLNTARS